METDGALNHPAARTDRDGPGALTRFATHSIEAHSTQHQRLEDPCTAPALPPLRDTLRKQRLQSIRQGMGEASVMHLGRLSGTDLEVP
ncbi:hypothetical protein GCM10009828_093030 [Actinoplanes couchii]